MSKKYTRNNVMQAIKIAFPNLNNKVVLDMLDFYGKESYEYEKERVQLAIIKISGGDILKLQEYVNIAKIDYRDVLMSAEYSQEGLEIKEPYREIGIQEKGKKKGLDFEP